MLCPPPRPGGRERGVGGGGRVRHQSRAPRVPALPSSRLGRWIPPFEEKGGGGVGSGRIPFPIRRGSPDQTFFNVLRDPPHRGRGMGYPRTFFGSTEGVFFPTEMPFIFLFFFLGLPGLPSPPPRYDPPLLGVVWTRPPPRGGGRPGLLWALDRPSISPLPPIDPWLWHRGKCVGETHGAQPIQWGVGAGGGGWGNHAVRNSRTFSPAPFWPLWSHGKWPSAFVLSS